MPSHVNDVETKHKCSKLLKQNKTLLFFKKWYQNQTKTLQSETGFLKDRTKLLVFLKNFGNRPEQKLLEQKCIVQNKNILFRSRILILKER